MSRFVFSSLALAFALCLSPITFAEDTLALPPGIKSTQRAEDVPLSPLAALAKITTPKGFHTTLFAGEPQVRQPIAMTFDDRGRLWVAECYAYRDWAATGSDRLLIFEDTNNDGEFDKRKVFWDEGNYLTGFQLGFGGVWVCCAPHFMFIPDRNQDDRPDGPPEKLLDGWSTKGVHNVLNGLDWGPDGWLYGCNGITAPSLVGKIGAKKEDRLPISCGIWRYHPTRHEFEVVAHGTTNPWGIDWNDRGQCFFANCVIEHLWQLIPGAHYKRMFGEDDNPYTYALMQSCSDHLHWAGQDWTKSRNNGHEHDKLGGGHAHCGTMVYLGGSWPEEYKNSVFTCNIHGNRVNRDTLVRSGSAYVGKHDDDFLTAHDPWFRGVSVKYGPDGGVFVSDWTDLGECHDRDGVHRDSGRIYKVVYGEPAKLPAFNVAKMSDVELAQLQQHTNHWWSRQARRVLQERAQKSKPSAELASELEKLAAPQQEVTIRLRAIWAQHVVGLLNEDDLMKLLDDKEEDVRWWAISFLVEHKTVSTAVHEKLVSLAASDPSGQVRLGLASALQRMPYEQRWSLATALSKRSEDAKDANIPLMIWYGMEPAIPTDRGRAIDLTVASKIPLLRQHIARRMAEKE